MERPILRRILEPTTTCERMVTPVIIFAGMAISAPIFSKCEQRRVSSDRINAYQRIVQTLPPPVQAEIGDPTPERVDAYFALFDRYHCLAREAAKRNAQTSTSLGDVQIYPLNPVNNQYDLYDGSIKLLVVNKKDLSLTLFADLNWNPRGYTGPVHFGTLDEVAVNGSLEGYRYLSLNQQTKFYEQYRTIITQMIPVLEERVHSIVICKPIKKP